jgi:hypothetical protein
MTGDRLLGCSDKSCPKHIISRCHYHTGGTFPHCNLKGIWNIRLLKVKQIQPLSAFKSFKEEVFLSRLSQAQHFPKVVLIKHRASKIVFLMVNPSPNFEVGYPCN